MSTNKEVVKSAKEILQEMGYDISTGHIYEFLSKLGGHPSWNVANAKDVDFSKVVVNVLNIPKPVTLEIPNLKNNLKVFLVKVSFGEETKCVKCYKINADSEEEANLIISEYLEFRSENPPSVMKYSQTKLLLAIETKDDFLYKNWEIFPDSPNPKVEYAVEVNKSGKILKLNEEQLSLILNLLVTLKESLTEKEIQENPKFNLANVAFSKISTGKEVTLTELMGLLDTIGGTVSAAHLASDKGILPKEIKVFEELMAVAEDLNNQWQVKV